MRIIVLIFYALVVVSVFISGCGASLTTFSANPDSHASSHSLRPILDLTMDNENGINLFTDQCGKEITNNGVISDTSQKQNGFSSGYFSSFSYLELDDSDDWAFANKNFSIEFFVDFEELPGKNLIYIILDQTQGGEDYQYLGISNNSGKYYFFYEAFQEGIVNIGFSYQINLQKEIWYKLKMQRIDGICYLYKDQILVGQSEMRKSNPNINAKLRLGADNNLEQGFKGWLDDFVIKTE